jgi:hypothetical protein
MPCYFPLTGYRSKELTPKNKRKIVFNLKYAIDDSEVTIPCGSCIGCRFEKSRQWALRCVHEASIYDDNCFITLTYSPETLPANNSLDKTHFQKFMKRLRKEYVPTNPFPIEQKSQRDQWQLENGIRFYQCGEYGEKNDRPHYHACLFNFDFPDKIFWKTTKNGDKLYTSPSLDKIWSSIDDKTKKPITGGFCVIGELNFKTAAYTARYIMKKINGKDADEHYRYDNPVTGEQHIIIPEYTTMSRRPGVGNQWFKNFKSDVYPSDEVIIKGIPMKPPKYYDSILEKENPFLYDDIKHDRLTNAEKTFKDYTPERLHVKHQVKLAQLKLLNRTLEEN